MEHFACSQLRIYNTRSNKVVTRGKIEIFNESLNWITLKTWFLLGGVRLRTCLNPNNPFMWGVRRLGERIPHFISSLEKDLCLLHNSRAKERIPVFFPFLQVPSETLPKLARIPTRDHLWSTQTFNGSSVFPKLGLKRSRWWLCPSWSGASFNEVQSWVGEKDRGGWGCRNVSRIDLNYPHLFVSRVNRWSLETSRTQSDLLSMEQGIPFRIERERDPWRLCRCAMNISLCGADFRLVLV